MELSPAEQQRTRDWLANWKVAAVELEKLKAETLKALTEEESARQFNDLDCDPALLWISPERLLSSGLVEQQRLFSKAHEHSPGFRRRT
jgi:hypothetical protein